MDGQLYVQVAEDGADAERLETLTGYLRDELCQLDVQDVTALRAAEEAPPGARSQSSSTRFPSARLSRVAAKSHTSRRVSNRYVSATLQRQDH